MAHNHDHVHDQREGNKKGLIIALAITTVIMILEFFGGLFTNIQHAKLKF